VVKCVKCGLRVTEFSLVNCVRNKGLSTSARFTSEILGTMECLNMRDCV
jgi:hypothetical protein